MPQTNRLNLPSAPPKQQAENKDIWNELRSASSADFFTFGYTSRKIEDIIGTLKRYGVRTLIDIRCNPVSMYRPELSKNNLSRILSQHGLNYAHVPELGVPRDIRAKAIETGTRDVIWDWYDNVVASFLGSNLHFFLNGFEHPVALMCTEIDPHECHRHRLSLALEEMGMSSFEI
ncbi:MAG TPA: DUF488 domain-containing protein [Candidatus Acidoferrales bacterium]|nr:DUF488 domain-containing protein [Candidatus Acidoferrales bacterium]